MAKTPVTLKVADYADREVMHVHYSFDQAVDKEGQMSGIPRGGYIEVTVKAMNDGNADALLSKVDVDGGLIGGASLVPEKFEKIVAAAQK